MMAIEKSCICMYDIEDRFYVTQLKEDFARIRITDHSIDLAEREKRTLSYFTEKFARELDAEQNALNRYQFIDLFCGAGGLSVGLEQEGFRPSFAIDKDKSALMTYRFNRPWLEEENIINDDIRHLVNGGMFEFAPLVVGGPPCQGFSNANKQRKENDDRNGLYKFYVHSVSQVNPDVFLLENVEGILVHIKEIREDFTQIGYHTFDPIILNTKDFGFPQNRKRAFVLGVHAKYANILNELYQAFSDTIQSEKGKADFCLWDAISDLPVLEAKTARNDTYAECKLWGYTYGAFVEPFSPYATLINDEHVGEIPILNHKSKYNNMRDIEIYKALRPGEKSDAESIQDLNPYKNRDDIFKDKFCKLRADEPCKTITAHMYYDCHMYIHPFSARGLTPREAARVQGFPDDYLFLGLPNEWYRQIGNAVSPLLARVIGKALHHVLQRIYRV